MDKFTRNGIPARYWHNTLDLHVLENVRSSLAPYVTTVTAKYLSFVGIHHGGQGRPGINRTLAAHVPRLPLCLDTEGVNRGQTMETATAGLYFLLKHAYISVILHMI